MLFCAGFKTLTLENWCKSTFTEDATVDISIHFDLATLPLFIPPHRVNLWKKETEMKVIF